MVGQEKTTEKIEPLMRILLVDDDPIFRRIMGHHAEREGVLLTCARSSLDFINDSQKGNFDVAILDYNLGLVNGLELAAHFRKLGNESPIILISATTYEVVLRLLEKGEKDSLKSQAHRLKGLAYNVAAEKLAAVCAQIEESAAKSQMEEARANKSKLIQEWQNLITFLQKDLAA